MNLKEKEQIDKYIRELEEAIKFLNSQEDVEIWTANEFLTNLNIKFDKQEMKKSIEEPTDIIFRDANFQIKAIYDIDRKMLKEYKDALIKAQKAQTYSEALNLEVYMPIDISLQDIVNPINEILEGYRLSPEQYEKIDM